MNHDVQPIKLKKYPSIQCSYFETSSRMFINTTNSYHRRGAKDISKGVYFSDIANINYNTHIPSNSTANHLLHEYSEAYDINNKLFIYPYNGYDADLRSPQDCGQDVSVSIITVSKETQFGSTKTISSQSIPLQCPARHDMIYSIYGSNNKRTQNSIATYTVSSAQELRHGEKYTSCSSSLHNMCNEQFVKETIQRNERLKNIVKNLVTEREKEKRSEVWNNFINHLRIKHGYEGNEPTIIAPSTKYKRNDPDFIDQYYNMRYESYQPRQCHQHDLFCDCYGPQINLHPNSFYKYPYNIDNKIPPIEMQYYNSDCDCYPMSSQGRYIIQKKTQEGNRGSRNPTLNQSSRNKSSDYKYSYNRDHSNVKKHSCYEIDSFHKERNSPRSNTRRYSVQTDQQQRNFNSAHKTLQEEKELSSFNFKYDTPDTKACCPCPKKSKVEELERKRSDLIKATNKICPCKEHDRSDCICGQKGKKEISTEATCKLKCHCCDKGECKGLFENNEMNEIPVKEVSRDSTGKNVCHHSCAVFNNNKRALHNNGNLTNPSCDCHIKDKKVNEVLTKGSCECKNKNYKSICICKDNCDCGDNHEKKINTFDNNEKVSCDNYEKKINTFDNNEKVSCHHNDEKKRNIFNNNEKVSCQCQKDIMKGTGISTKNCSCYECNCQKAKKGEFDNNKNLSKVNCECKTKNKKNCICKVCQCLNKDKEERSGDEKLNCICKDICKCDNDSKLSTLAKPKAKELEDKEQVCTSVCQVRNLEQKLDNLIEYFNTFVLEMRAKGLNNVTNDSITKSPMHRLSSSLWNTKQADTNTIQEMNTSVKISNISSETVTDIAETEDCRCVCECTCKCKKKTNNVVYTTMIHKTPHNIKISDIGSKTSPVRDLCRYKLDQIIQKEIDKSEKIKKDIEELFIMEGNKACSVEVSFDIPMKDISTEVTKSMFNRVSEKGVTIKEINDSKKGNGTCCQQMSNMSMAENTEPLGGWLGLLRVSVDTVKRFLSYVPSINYPRILLMQEPQYPCNFICNICGASFSRPSQLSNHIQRQHDLGSTRNCCICHHVVDLQRNSQRLFKCNYCGQRFTRAYCCELHQQTCAKQMGLLHEVSSAHE